MPRSRNKRPTKLRTKDRWRDIYITSYTGSLVAVVRAITRHEAEIQGIPHVDDWRSELLNHSLTFGDNMLCDDGYIVPVTKVQYTPKTSITLVTGTWQIPSPINANFLKWFFITSNPRKSSRSNAAERRTHTVSLKANYTYMRAAAINYLSNGFNANQAYCDTFKLSGISNTTSSRYFSQPQMRYTLMSEAIKWFNQAGITPDKVLNAWFNGVFKPDTEAAELNDAMKLYAMIHPDMEIKGVTPVRSPQSPTNFYLGDQQNFQQLNAIPPDKLITPKPRALDAAVDPVAEPATFSEEKDECVNVLEPSRPSL